MTLLEARELRAGDMVYSTVVKNARGVPMRAKVTSVKFWKRDSGRIEVRVKHGLYDYATFTGDELRMIETTEQKAIEALG